MVDNQSTSEKTMCPQCKVVYPSKFDVQISIETVPWNGNKGVIGGLSNEFDIRYSGYDIQWIAISKDVLEIKSEICDACIRRFIDEDKIVNWRFSQYCYKCDKKYKSYNEFMNRFIVRYEDGLTFGSYYYYKFRNWAKYRIDENDFELIKHKTNDFYRNMTAAEMKVLQSKSSSALSICQRCIGNTKRHDEITNCRILPPELSDIVYEYTPELLIYQCKLCEYKPDSLFIGHILDNNVLILDYCGDMRVRSNRQKDFDNFNLDANIICSRCAFKMIDDDILYIYNKFSFTF